MLGAMAGSDARDSTCVDVPVPDYADALERPVKGLRIGIIREFFGDGLDPGVGSAVRAALDGFQAAGADAGRRQPAEPAAVGAERTMWSRRRNARRTCRATMACASATAARNRAI